MKNKMDHKIPNKMLVVAENRKTHSSISSVESIQKNKNDTFKTEKNKS